MYQIDNYSVTSKSDPYLPPELARKQIQGQVKNHPAYKDGTKIITSDIIAVNGRVVKTANSETVVNILIWSKLQLFQTPFQLFLPGH